MTKVLVNRHLAALAAALQRHGVVRGMAHKRRARMPRLDVSGPCMRAHGQRAHFLSQSTCNAAHVHSSCILRWRGEDPES